METSGRRQVSEDEWIETSGRRRMDEDEWIGTSVLRDECTQRRVYLKTSVLEGLHWV